jgi:hypothetical protein
MRLPGQLDLEDLDRTPGAAAFSSDWLAFRGEEPGPLFYPVRKNGASVVQDKPMSFC